MPWARVLASVNEIICQERGLSMTRPALPPQIRVVVRDWLSANQIVLRGRDGNVLIDTGYVTRAATTLTLLQDCLEGERVDLLVNTHCHSDHMGGNAAVQRVYGCPTLVPADEAPLIRAWDVRALWIDYTGQQAERFAVDGVLAARGDPSLGRSGLADDPGAGSRRRRTGVLEPGRAHPDLGRCAVGARLRPGHAGAGQRAGRRPTHPGNDRGARPAHRDPGARHAIHRRGGCARALLRARAGIARQPRAHGPPRPQGHADFHSCSTRAACCSRICPDTWRRFPSIASSTNATSSCRRPNWPSRLVAELERAGAVRREAGRLIPM